MSENSSLFLQVQITEAGYQEFMNSAVSQLENHSVWLAWLNQVGNFGQITENHLNNLNPNTGIVSEQIADYCEHVHYDGEKELLQIDKIFLGENLDEILPTVIFLQGVAKYVKPATEHNFLVVYPYWWGDRETVNDYASLYLEFSQQQTDLVISLNPANMTIATAYYEQYGDQYAHEFVDKYGYM